MSPPDSDQQSPASQARVERVFANQRAFAPAVRATSADQRKDKLEHLRQALIDRRAEVHDALQADFAKAAVEVDITEIKPVLDEIGHAVGHLDEWMAPNRVGTPLLFTGTRSEIHFEPKGVGLVISPWNYPLLLTLGPLVGAIAAGNCVVVKPSEHTPHMTAVLKSLLAELFDEREVAIVQGGKEVGQALLQQPFDHIYFTGSTRVGRLVMEAAAQHPTSVTLELGGKSPTVVDASADIDHAAERIAWGKFTNAGQTCIAPDYVLVESSAHDALIERLETTIRQFYGSSEEARQQSDDYARIINDEEWHRLADLLDDAVADGATVAIGGERDHDARYVSPTVLTGVSLDSRIMHEEIFGPLLPVLTFETLDEALEIINARPAPLSLYAFSTRNSTVDAILDRTTAGSTCVNETLLHFGNPELPFGGTGESGMGRGHGEAGFHAFSNQRSVLRRSYGASLLRALFPPYTGLTERLMKWLVR